MHLKTCLLFFLSNTKYLANVRVVIDCEAGNYGGLIKGDRLRYLIVYLNLVSSDKYVNKRSFVLSSVFLYVLINSNNSGSVSALIK